MRNIDINEKQFQQYRSDSEMFDGDRWVLITVASLVRFVLTIDELFSFVFICCDMIQKMGKRIDELRQSLFQ